ncbi:MAG: MBL fold metallo-hydrolase [Bacilli bacterium]|nr:MBL fold metallo-hydrolase [Bacilli bacterium]
MKFTYIRNATYILEYGGTRFLVDPMLGARGSLPSFPSGEKGYDPNPCYNLPMTLQKALDVDAIILTSLAPDHFDEKAEKAINKATPLYVQNRIDAEKLEAKGFHNVTIMEGKEVLFNDTEFRKVGAKPGLSPSALDYHGLATGVMMCHPEEPILYLTGDTVFYEGMVDAIAKYQPAMIVVSCGGNGDGEDRYTMDEIDVGLLHRICPEATMIAIHMQATNDWNISINWLAGYVESRGFADKVYIPFPGQTFDFDDEEPDLDIDLDLPES